MLIPARLCSDGVGESIDFVGLVEGWLELGKEGFRVMMDLGTFGTDWREVDREDADGGRGPGWGAELSAVGRGAVCAMICAASASPSNIVISSRTSEVVGVGTGDRKVTFLTPGPSPLTVLARIVSSS